MKDYIEIRPDIIDVYISEFPDDVIEYEFRRRFRGDDEFRPTNLYDEWRYELVLKHYKTKTYEELASFFEQ